MSNKMMDDEMLDKESYNSGSLGQMKVNQSQYMDMLGQQHRRQTLQVNPKALGELDHQMLLEQNQLQLQIQQAMTSQNDLIGRSATFKAMPSAPPLPNQFGSQS